MLFIALMFITTSCVAGAAAFFSVYGLAHTFAASFWSVVFMGGSLEAGKLMLASYLYRFKDTVTTKSKALGYAFVLVLMLITSLGIYGYLADAYQSGSTDMKQVNASLDLKKQEQTNLQKRKGEIDAQIAQVAIKDVRGKQRLMTQFGPEVNTINTRLIALTAEIQQEAQKQITTDSHVGPIVFVAKIVGMEPDHAISLLILMIVFAFDPLAIYLTIATNTALAKYNEKKDEKEAELEPVEPLRPEYNATPGGMMEDFVAPIDEHDTVADYPAHYDPSADQWDEPEYVTDAVVPVVYTDLSAEELTEFVEVEGPTEDIVLESPFPLIEEDLVGVPLVEDTVNIVDDAPAITTDVNEFLPRGHSDKLGRINYFPPEELSAPPTAADFFQLKGPDMKVLGKQFSQEATEDVAFEEGTEAPPEQQLVKIYEETAAKAEPTPVDIETMTRIERFFARQDLIKNVRSGTVE